MTDQTNPVEQPESKWTLKNVNFQPEQAKRVEIARLKDQRSFSNMVGILVEYGLAEFWKRRGEIEPMPESPRDVTEPVTEVP